MAKAVRFPNIYPLGRDLSGIQRYPTFEQWGPLCPVCLSFQINFDLPTTDKSLFFFFRVVAKVGLRGCWSWWEWVDFLVGILQEEMSP